MFTQQLSVLLPLFIFACASVALGPSPSLVSLAITLTLVRAYVSQALSLNIGQQTLHSVILWLCLSLATTVAHVLPATSALSSAWTSLALLHLISSLVSFVALATIGLEIRLSQQLHSSWSKVVIFPAFWATIWQTLAFKSPLGRLITWSPVLGIESYGWTKPVLGPWGVDWVVASFAVVGSDVVGTWLSSRVQLDRFRDEQLIDIDDEPSSEQRHVSPHLSSGSKPIFALSTLLLLLAVPSYFLHPLPLPPFSSSSTPITVGCVLPPPPKPNDHTSALDRFILESQRVVPSGAKIMLWPEGAVHFESPDERDKAIFKVRQMIRGPYVGISFVENAPSGWQGHGHTDKKRIGLVLVGPDGPVFEYYKRNLVPVAESFSAVPSYDPPTVYHLPLPPPAHTNKTDWSHGPPYVRPVPLTASICLDFASPSTFAELSSRPALILAPARTWHPDVGLAIWGQAKARAEEAGSMVLFCDGGHGGVSGVAGQGMNEIMQIGSGSWTRTIGVQWPFNERRTAYIYAGNYTALMILWGLVGLVWAGEFVRREYGLEGFVEFWHTLTESVSDLATRLNATIRSWRQRRGEEQPLLQ